MTSQQPDDWFIQAQNLREELAQELSQDQIKKCSEKLTTLSENLTARCHEMPSYNQRRCEMELKELGGILAAKLKPKPKFSFRQTKAARVPTPVSTPKFEVKSEFRVPDSLLKITNQSRKLLSIQHLPAVETQPGRVLVLSNLEVCQVYLVNLGEHSFQTAYLSKIKNSILFLPVVEGSVMVDSCENSVLVLGAHQFRMHSSNDCRVLLANASDPIVENCSNLWFGPYPSDLTTIPPLLKSPSLATIKDFDHPFATEAKPSPNIKLLASGYIGSVAEAYKKRDESWKSLLL